MFRVGTKVVVKKRSDSQADEKLIGAFGKIVGRVTDDVGATPKDPLFIVRFSRMKKDGFWGEELERYAPPKRARKQQRKGGRR